MITKPLLAATLEDAGKLKYPVMCSPKLDGIRCLMVNGKAVSRAFKAIPNKFTREWLEKYVPDWVDGELMVNGSFSEVQSAFMSADGVPDFYYAVFDYAPNTKIKFSDRLDQLKNVVANIDSNRVRLVEHVLINNEHELLAFEEKCLAEGYEGVMVRNPNVHYKCGRSTLNEGILLKLKRFADSEAEILDFKELMSNQNEAEEDAFGHTKRSSAKDGMVPADTLGHFIVRDIHSGVLFDIGTGEGLTQDLRKHIWTNKEDYIHKILKYKYFPTGSKDKPRFPVMIGLRDKIDM